MKTKVTILSVMALFFSITSIAQVDLLPGISYSYNPPGANGIITSIDIDAVNNGTSAASSFTVAMYLYDSGTGNYWIIGTTNVPSLSGSSSINISGWDININNTTGIPNGAYRLGVWVDSNGDVTESDESNNAGLLSGTINYVASAGVSEINNQVSDLLAFPNPATETTTISFTLKEQTVTTIKIMDVTGKLVSLICDKEQLSIGEHRINYSTENLTKGIYYYSVSTDKGTITKKLVVI